MSKKENVTETPVQEEKIITRYDRKLQKRKEQEAKELKEKKIFRIVGYVILALIVCFIASFPIRSLMALKEAYIEIDGEDVTKVEFDYYYNMSVSTYYSQNGMYLAMMGIDLTKDLSTQQYSQDLTWKDFFEKMAVESIKQNKALLKEAKANGFTFDVDTEWKNYKEMVKDQAAEASLPVNTFVKSSFGSYATLGRIKDIVKSSIYTGAYAQKIQEERMPSDEDVQAYYEENKDEFDSVDFRLVQVDAELPEEGQPTEAQIEEAMKKAKEEAEKALKTVAKEGELREDYTKAIVNSNYSEWIYDASRKAGDTTMVEDATNHRYYVVAFEKRYLKEDPTANARVILTEKGKGQEILNEWKSGAATEESFIELVKKYSADAANTNDGLYEGITASLLSEEMSAWLFAAERKVGDTAVFAVSDTEDYVFYFKEFGDYEWEIEARSIIVNTIMSEYMAELVKDMELNDPNRKLFYLEMEEFNAAMQEYYEKQQSSSSAAE